MQISNSFNTQSINNINQNKANTESILSKIAAVRELSGKDGSNLMIADSLNSQISSLTQGVQNANDGIGMLQIADGTLSNLSQSADKLNQLSVRYNSAALNSDQKAMLQQEFSATTQAMQDMVQQTTYNGKQIFGQTMSFEMGNGSIDVSALQVSGIDSMSIDNQNSIQSFMDNLDQTRSDVGSAMNQFETSITNSLSAVSNLSSSKSNIEETPMDKKISDLNQNQLKLEVSMLAQAHQNNQLQKRISALLV